MAAPVKNARKGTSNQLSVNSYQSTIISDQ